MNTNSDGSKKIQDFLKPRANYGYDKNGKKKKSSYGNTNQGYFIPKNRQRRTDNPTLLIIYNIKLNN